MPRSGLVLGDEAERPAGAPGGEGNAGGGQAGMRPPQHHTPLLSPHLEENRQTNVGLRTNPRPPTVTLGAGRPP